MGFLSFRNRVTGNQSPPHVGEPKGLINLEPMLFLKTVEVTSLMK